MHDSSKTTSSKRNHPKTMFTESINIVCLLHFELKNANCRNFFEISVIRLERSSYWKSPVAFHYWYHHHSNLFSLFFWHFLLLLQFQAFLYLYYVAMQSTCDWKMYICDPHTILQRQLRMLPLRKSRHEWNDNIKMLLQEIVWQDVSWIPSSQFRGK